MLLYTHKLQRSRVAICLTYAYGMLSSHKQITHFAIACTLTLAPDFIKPCKPERSHYLPERTFLTSVIRKSAIKPPLPLPLSVARLQATNYAHKLTPNTAKRNHTQPTPKPNHFSSTSCPRQMRLVYKQIYIGLNWQQFPILQRMAERRQHTANRTHNTFSWT